MQILFVASYNKGYFAPFIVEQAEALRLEGCDVELFGITGKGISGYVKSLPALKKQIKESHPDIIHAHYGLSGLFANMQRKIPVVTTYHGSDINEKTVLPFTKLSMLLSRFNIFVSKRTMDIAHPHKKFALIPCGIDLNDLQLTDRRTAREELGLSVEKKYVLFSGSFGNPVKNHPLAREAMSLVPDAELLELKGYTREQVTLLMCAADALLMTSFTEGSPQVVKEAMACGGPVVSVDVGDVKEVTSGIEGCQICDRSAESLATALRQAFERTEKTDGRQRIIDLGYTNDIVAKKLQIIYNSIP